MNAVFQAISGSGRRFSRLLDRLFWISDFNVEFSRLFFWFVKVATWTQIRRSSKQNHFELPVVKTIRFWIASRQNNEILGCRSSKQWDSGLLVVKTIRFWVAGCRNNEILGCQLSKQWDSGLPVTKPNHFELPVVKTIRFWVAIIKTMRFWVAGCQNDKTLGCLLSKW